jgi:hypothetical protein
MIHKINAKTAKGQAGQMLRAVRKEARKSGAPETAVLLKEHDDGFTMWRVVWEDGPFDWAIIGAGKGNIWGEELGYCLYDRRLKPTFEFASHVRFEHYYSFDIVFYHHETY